MGNVVLATAVLSDAATLSSSGTVSGTLPLTNLQTMQPGEVCRFTSLTGMNVVADLGAAAAINLAALLDHNGTAAATWRVRAFDNAGDAADPRGYKLVSDATAAATHSAFRDFAGAQSGVVYKITADLKADDLNFGALVFSSQGGAYSVSKTAWFNLSTGALGTIDSGITAAITSLGNGWYRCEASLAANATNSARFAVYLAETNGSLTFNGNSVKGIFVNRVTVAPPSGVNVFGTDKTMTDWTGFRATWTSNAVDSPSGYDSGSISMWPTSGKPSGWEVLPSLLFLTTAKTYRWWRFDITDAANPDGYFDIGRLYIAAAWQPEVNLSYGWGLKIDDPSLIDESIAGQTYVTERPVSRQLTFRLGFQTEDELYDNAFELFRVQGKKRDVLAIRDPDATTHLHRQTIYGLMSDLPPIVNPDMDIYETGIQVKELLP